MSRWAPIKRRPLLQKLRRMGFEGPYSGTRHEFLVYASHRLTIPNNPEFSVPQLRFMLREVEQILGREISAEEWETL